MEKARLVLEEKLRSVKDEARSTKEALAKAEEAHRGALSQAVADYRSSSQYEEDVEEAAYGFFPEGG